jgi:hypothetical protein
MEDPEPDTATDSGAATSPLDWGGGEWSRLVDDTERKQSLTNDEPLEMEGSGGEEAGEQISTRQSALLPPAMENSGFSSDSSYERRLVVLRSWIAGDKESVVPGQALVGMHAEDSQQLEVSGGEDGADEGGFSMGGHSRDSQGSREGADEVDSPLGGVSVGGHSFDTQQSEEASDEEGEIRAENTISEHDSQSEKASGEDDAILGENPISEHSHNTRQSKKVTGEDGAISEDATIEPPCDRQRSKEVSDDKDEILLEKLQAGKHPRDFQQHEAASHGCGALLEEYTASEHACDSQQSEEVSENRDLLLREHLAGDPENTHAAVIPDVELSDNEIGSSYDSDSDQSVMDIAVKEPSAEKGQGSSSQTIIRGLIRDAHQEMLYFTLPHSQFSLEDLRQGLDYAQNQLQTASSKLTLLSLLQEKPDTSALELRSWITQLDHLVPPACHKPQPSVVFHFLSDEELRIALAECVQSRLVMEDEVKQSMALLMARVLAKEESERFEVAETERNSAWGGFVGLFDVVETGWDALLTAYMLVVIGEIYLWVREGDPSQVFWTLGSNSMF